MSATFVGPASPTAMVPSAQRPSSHGRPDGWRSSRVAWARSATPAGAAASQSGRTTNQEEGAPGPASPAILGVLAMGRWSSLRSIGNVLTRCVRPPAGFDAPSHHHAYLGQWRPAMGTDGRKWLTVNYA